MRHTALPLLALALLAGAVVAARACCGDPEPAPGRATPAQLTDERVDRRRVDAATRIAPDSDGGVSTAEDDEGRDDASTEPFVQLRTRDAELALERRFVSGIVVTPDGQPVAGEYVELTSRWLPAEVARQAAIPRNSLSGPSDYVPPPLLPEMTSSMSTGSDGRFRLPYVVGDYLWITAQLHRAPVERPHEELRIVLAAAPTEVEVRVTRASDGGPVMGAVVQANAWQEATTDERGLARLSPAPIWTGVWRLSVRAEGLATVEDRSFELSPEVDERVEVALLPEYLVRGQVVDDATGRPVPGATVRSGVPRHWRRPPMTLTLTDADGRFELRGLPRRERTSVPIGATADGYVPVARWLPSELPPEGFREVELRMVRGGSIRLRCVDGGGVPVSNALVYAEGDVTRGGPDRYDRLTDINDGGAWTESDGVAVIADLPHDDDPIEVRVYFRGVEVVRRGCPSPAAGEQVDLGDVVVALGGRLTGTVRTAEGTPAAGVAVVIVPDDPADEHLYALADAALHPADERHGVTDGEGRFEIPGLAPGTWHALAWTQGGEHAPRLVRGIVVPVEGDPSPLAIRLPVAVVIHGVALDEDGMPLAGVEIGALRDSPVGINLMETTTTDEHGRFRLPGVSALGERVWVEIDHGDCRGELITVGRAPLELHFDRMRHFDPDEHDRAMGR